MKRIAIASFVIKCGRLYLYQKFLLEELLKVTDKIILVSESALDEENRKWCIAHNVLNVQSKKNFDVSMWQQIVQSSLFRGEMMTFSELILLNDSFFGPVYPFEEVFSQMDDENIDFWGISAHGQMVYVDGITKKERISPRFLQRYFIVIREKMFRSAEWEEFWKELGDILEYWETEQKFEYVFSEFFEKKGFSWTSFCKTSDWEKNEPRRNMSFIIYRAYDMLKEKGLPIISRPVFENSKEIELCYHYGNESNRVLKFVENNTNYDLELIWEYLIDTLNPYALWRNLNLTYILSEKKKENSLNEISDTILIAHLYYTDLFEKNVSYLQDLPSRVDLLITTDSSTKVETLQKICAEKIKNKYKILLVENRGREWAALLLYAKKYMKVYKYFGFIHDKKSNQMFYSTVGKAFDNYIWENILPSADYVEGVIGLLEKEKRMGMLAPPIVYHGEFWKHSRDFWTSCFEGTFQLARRIELKVVPQKEYPVLTVGSCFWGKVDAFNKLFQYPFHSDDFPDEPMDIDGTFNHFLERILSFVVQDSGYYTGLILSNEYAKCDITNLRSMIQEIEEKLERNLQVDMTSTWSMIQSMEKKKVDDKKSFWKRRKK